MESQWRNEQVHEEIPGLREGQPGSLSPGAPSGFLVLFPPHPSLFTVVQDTRGTKKANWTLL